MILMKVSLNWHTGDQIIGALIIELKTLAKYIYTSAPLLSTFIFYFSNIYKYRQDIQIHKYTQEDNIM